MSHYPHVLDEYQTISLLKEGKSIARYGDGEIKLCRGAATKCQDYDVELSHRLKEIIKYEKSECVIGIPRIGHMSEVAQEKHGFWSKYVDQTQFFNFQKVYGSAFITRPDSIPYINTFEYFGLIQSLWTDKRVVLLNGDNRRFDRDSSILDNAASWDRWEVPPENAWREYPTMLKFCTLEPKDTLFILCVGPTATVLAYDLSQVGYQALDLGHLGMFYARLRRANNFPN